MNGEPTTTADPTQAVASTANEQPSNTPPPYAPFVEKREAPVILPGIVTVSSRDFATLCEERAEARVRLEIQRAKTERIRAELKKSQDELSHVREELEVARREAEEWRGKYYAAIATATERANVEAKQ